jgi:methylated-DNA-protein-cysteine methyltransferase-like protein
MKQKPGEFSKKVCELARTIPPGRVTTYGLLAVAAGGHPILAQMVTSILSRAPDADTMPWHRIVYSNGHIWVSPKYEKLRRKLYAKEGIKLDKNNRIIDFEKIIYTFDK